MLLVYVDDTDGDVMVAACWYLIPYLLHAVHVTDQYVLFTLFQTNQGDYNTVLQAATTKSNRWKAKDV